MSDTRSSESFTFSMGEFKAVFPLDRHYAKNHMWAQCVESGDAGGETHSGDSPSSVAEGAGQRWRFGLTAYAVRLLQDVYFLDWEAEPPVAIANRQMIGSIESKKAESDLYAPLSGTLVAINEAVLEDPSLINADPYGKGWLIEFMVTGTNAEHLLVPVAYQLHLDDAWEVAQRTIKGQANV